MSRQDTELPEGYKMTELGPLPEEWRVVRLGEVAHITSGGSAPQGDIYFGGKHPFVRVQHLGEGDFFVQRWDLITDEAVKIYSLRLFPKGTIIFPKSGASIRLEKRAILPIPAYLVSHLCAVIPDIRLVERNFLFYALKNRRLAAEKAEGYPTLTLAEIKEVPIPLPSLPEQRAIAHVLRTVQEAKETTERVIAALRDLKKSLMRHLFTYGPVPIGDVGAQRAVPLRETEIGLIPEHWRVVRLGEVADTKSGGTPDRSKPEYFGGPIPWVKSGELNDTEVFFVEESLTEAGLKNSNAKVFPKGTLLIAMYGATAGKVGILGLDAASNQAVCAIFPYQHLLSNYLFYALIQKREVLLSQRYGGAQPNISQTIIKNLLVPLPPLPEQQQIAAILQAVDRRIQAEENYARALEALFKTLLHHLMTGKVRVNSLSFAQGG